MMRANLGRVLSLLGIGFAACVVPVELVDEADTDPLPTCNDGRATIDPGEQCDGNNLGAQTCVSQGFYGGSLSCQPNCNFETTDCYPGPIASMPGWGVWTPVVANTSGCGCEEATPSCYTLYTARVTSIAGNIAHMQFKKHDGTPPSVDVSFWVVVGDTVPTCLELSTYVARIIGTWENPNPTLDVDVNIWPDEAAFEAAPCGDTMSLFVVTGGGGGYAHQRAWFQWQAVVYTKTCM